MDKNEFQDFIDQCYQRGLTRVQTNGGSLDLDQWHPYGAFDGSNPGIEKHIGGFLWINATQAADYPASGPTSGINGVWTFLKEQIEEDEELRREQETNYFRQLGV